jgi:hypothetical protein
MQLLVLIPYQNLTYINCNVILNCRLTVVDKEKGCFKGRRFAIENVNVFTRKGIAKKKCMRLKKEQYNKCKKCGIIVLVKDIRKMRFWQ